MYVQVLGVSARSSRSLISCVGGCTHGFSSFFEREFRKRVEVRTRIQEYRWVCVGPAGLCFDCVFKRVYRAMNFRIYIRTRGYTCAFLYLNTNYIIAETKNQ